MTGALDHTSILRFLSDKYDLGSLGNRTAAAASFADAITSSANDDTPKRVGVTPRPAEMLVVTDSTPPVLNRNQAALIDFTRHLEVEMNAPPADVGMRAMKATTGVQGEVEAARERVRLFLDQ